MPVTLSTKNAPDEVVRRLKARAIRHHRSLQGELMAIIEEAAKSDEKVTVADILEEARRLKLATPSESAAIIRAARDAR
jgi:plasmid stability protein